MVAFFPMLASILLVFFPDRLRSWWFVMPVVGQQVLIGKSLGGESVLLLSAAVLATVTVVAAVPTLAIRDTCDRSR
jgi:hypothetical protein